MTHPSEGTQATAILPTKQPGSGHKVAPRQSSSIVLAASRR